MKKEVDKERQHKVKVEVVKAKQRGYGDLYAGWTARRERLMRWKL